MDVVEKGGSQLTLQCSRLYFNDVWAISAFFRLKIEHTGSDLSLYTQTTKAQIINRPHLVTGVGTKNT